jgi:hypothetical protein
LAAKTPDHSAGLIDRVISRLSGCNTATGDGCRMTDRRKANGAAKGAREVRFWIGLLP